MKTLNILLATLLSLLIPANHCSASSEAKLKSGITTTQPATLEELPSNNLEHITHSSHAFFVVFLRKSDCYRVNESESKVEISADPNTIVSSAKEYLVVCKGRIKISGHAKRQVIHTKNGVQEITISPGKVTSIDEYGNVEHLKKNQIDKAFRNKSTRPTSIIAAPGSKFRVEEGKIYLRQGWFLVKTEDSQIRTESLNINTSGSSVVNIEYTSRFEKIGVCDGIGAVEMESKALRENLALGQELTLLKSCNKNNYRQELNTSNDGIMRRQFRSMSLTDGTTVIRNDFSIISMLSQAKHLEQLRKPSTLNDSAFRDLLLKNCIAYEMVSHKRGKYI